MIRGCVQSGVKVNWGRSVQVCTPEAETRRWGIAGASAGSGAHRGSAALNIYCSRLAFRFLCSHLERGHSAHQIIPRNTLPLLVYLCPLSLCFPVFARVVKATGAHKRGKLECVLLLLGLGRCVSGHRCFSLHLISYCGVYIYVPYSFGQASPGAARGLFIRGGPSETRSLELLQRDTWDA